MKNKIGIVVLATNGYFILGIRFLKKFMYHYKGESDVFFIFFSNKNPHKYLDSNIDYKYVFTQNSDWVSGTNMKFDCILKTKEINYDYIYYFDADTNIRQDFTENWFLGDLVGGQHFNDSLNKPFDRNPKSQAYIPEDTKLSQMYYYGAFFGGKKECVINMCDELKFYQTEDKKINYEPIINDESYINKYFHYNPPTKVVLTNNFKFLISDKGGLENLRNPLVDYENMIKDTINPQTIFEISNGKIYH